MRTAYNVAAMLLRQAPCRTTTTTFPLRTIASSWNTAPHSRLSPLVSRPLLRYMSSSSPTDPSSGATTKPFVELSQETKPFKPAPHRNPDEPVFQLQFKCGPCGHRQAHTISKQGYFKGTVLVTCPSCKNRHLITDHLHIFSDKAVTLEDLLADKGQKLQRGTVDQEGEIEFWSDADVDAAAAREQAKATEQPRLA